METLYKTLGILVFFSVVKQAIILYPKLFRGNLHTSDGHHSVDS